MLLALDDTDTLQGGCTTNTAFQIAVALDQAGGPLADVALAGPPRLVRLCPAAPHRTRGNGALAVPLGRKRGPPVVIGVRPGGAPLHCYPAAPGALDEAAIAALDRLVHEHLPAPGAGDEDPQPGAVLIPRQAERLLYERAVAGLVTIADAWSAAPPGTKRLTKEPRRGEIGALAATAWPAESWTWEATAYREGGGERTIDDGFRDAVLSVAGAFDNVDAGTGRLRCVPRTPCPVLWGVRGSEPGPLVRFLAARSPSAGAWLLQTNHATGDHARYAHHEPAPYQIVKIRVRVAERPRRMRGGHLFLEAHGVDGGALRLAAFEPTKRLRDALAQALPGDVIDVLARTGKDADTLAVEAFRFVQAVPRTRAGPNPHCGACGRGMKSIGSGAGFRCRACGTRRDFTARSTDSVAGPEIGVLHQVPDHVRGHLLPPAAGLPGSLSLHGAVRGRPTGPALSPHPIVAVVR